jgi:hypothetical protein
MHLIDDIENLIRHHPEGDTAMTDETASPSPIKTVEEHAAQAEAWLRKLIGESLPVVTEAASKTEELAAEVARWQQNPVVKLLEEAALSPEEYAALTGIVESSLALIGKAAHAVEEHVDAAEPATPEAPATPVVAGAQPQ